MFRKFSIRADAAPWSRHSVRALLSTDRLPRSSTVMAVLRICLGTVYLWFGALKLAGASTVNSLIEATLPWPTPGWLVPTMGALEVVIRAMFIWGRHLLLVLPLFVPHMAGTLSVLIMAPQLAFKHGDPALLTFTGEFVVKNLVLLPAGILVALASEQLRTPQQIFIKPLSLDPAAIDPTATKSVEGDALDR